MWQTRPVPKQWSGIDFYIAELERPIDTAAFAQQYRALNPDLESAFVTNNDTHSNPDYFRPMVAAGFAGLVEAYLSDAPNLTPEALVTDAAHRGVPNAQPVISLYAGRNGHPTIDSYGDLSRYPGWSGYLAEHIL